jgi:GNAT superfamily N-acetyltransferase
VERVYRSHRLDRSRGVDGGLLPAVVAAVVFAVWVGAGVGGGTVVRYVDDLATAAAALVAAGVCVRAARRQDGRFRLFWSLLAAATAAWALGELLWALYDLILLGSVPVPSWADAAYLAAIPLAAAALLVHPAMRGRSIGKTRAVLDGLVIASALFFLSWTMLLGPLWRTTDLSTLGGLVALAYPIGDVVVVLLVVLVIRGASNRTRLDLWFLLAGLLAITCSDAGYGYLTEVKGYATGNSIDTGWVVGYLAIALAARSSRVADAIEPAPVASTLSPMAIVAPFLPLFAALGLAAVRIELGHRLDVVGFATAFALVTLVLLRQALLAVDLLERQDRGHVPIGDRLLTAVGAAAPVTRSRR